MYTEANDLMVGAFGILGPLVPLLLAWITALEGVRFVTTMIMRGVR